MAVMSVDDLDVLTADLKVQPTDATMAQPRAEMTDDCKETVRVAMKVVMTVDETAVKLVLY